MKIKIFISYGIIISWLKILKADVEDVESSITYIIIELNTQIHLID